MGRLKGQQKPLSPVPRVPIFFMVIEWFRCYRSFTTRYGYVARFTGFSYAARVRLKLKTDETIFMSSESPPPLPPRKSKAAQINI